MPATHDRGDIIHFAGRHRLSPAIRDGAPALVAQGEPGERCGWEKFFRTLGARRLQVELQEAGTARFVPG